VAYSRCEQSLTAASAMAYSAVSNAQVVQVYVIALAVLFASSGEAHRYVKISLLPRGCPDSRRYSMPQGPHALWVGFVAITLILMPDCSGACCEPSTALKRFTFVNS